MADDNNIPFNKLSTERFNKATNKILSTESDDPEVKHIIEGMKKLLQEELKDIITVRVDGVLTEVGAYNREIFVFVGGLKKKVSTYYHNYIY